MQHNIYFSFNRVCLIKRECVCVRLFVCKSVCIGLLFVVFAMFVFTLIIDVPKLLQEIAISNYTRCFQRTL